MPRIAANLSFLFTDLPLLDRPAAAAEAGFDAVEIQFPYDAPAQDLRDRLLWAGIPLVLFNAPPPNYAGGEPGWAAVPGLEDRFRRDLARALRYASVLRPAHIHLMTGAADGPAARATLIANLRHTAATAPAQSFTIEVINRDDMPGWFLSDYDLALDVLAEVGAPNIRLQFDTWHAWKITGEVEATWDRVRADVAHVQTAGTPTRAEPGAAELAFLARLDAEGYDGWVGAEYRPAGATAAGLAWLAARR